MQNPGDRKVVGVFEEQRGSQQDWNLERKREKEREEGRGRGRGRQGGEGEGVRRGSGGKEQDKGGEAAGTGSCRQGKGLAFYSMHNRMESYQKVLNKSDRT